MGVIEALSHWCEEIEKLKDRIAKTRQKMGMELRELGQQGRDVKDPAFQSARQYLDRIEDIEREVVEDMENIVQWVKLELTESKIRYERGKRGLKEGETYGT